MASSVAEMGLLVFACCPERNMKQSGLEPAENKEVSWGSAELFTSIVLDVRIENLRSSILSIRQYSAGGGC